MNQTVVALYDEFGDAQSAVDALYQSGFTRADVKLSPAEDTHAARKASLHAQPADVHTTSWSIGDFFKSLFNRDQYSDDAGMYAEAMRRGAYMVSVDVGTDDQAARAADILQRFHPIDLDQRAGAWRSAGWQGYDAGAPLYTEEEIRNDRDLYSKTTIAGTPAQPAAASSQNPRPDTTAANSEGRTNETIPVIEEQLQVGKRAVQRGGIRVYQHLTETPVEETVQLREEQVTVARHPVNEPASAADIAAFKEGTIEVRATAEEPVIGKTARVVEEVEIGKQVSERTETIHDTVRRTDVDVEPLPADATSATQTTTSPAGSGGLPVDDEFRRHWQSAYGSSGGRYEDYSSAYRYGASLAGQKQYQGYRWDELEPQLKSDWEATHAGSPWERTRQAVRYGWEKMTSR